MSCKECRQVQTRRRDSSPWQWPLKGVSWKNAPRLSWDSILSGGRILTQLLRLAVMGIFLLLSTQNWGSNSSQSYSSDGRRKLSATADNICTTHCFFICRSIEGTLSLGSHSRNLFGTHEALCSVILLLLCFFLCIKIEIKKKIANSGKCDSVVEEQHKISVNFKGALVID